MISLADALSRGFANARANWQTIVARLIEGVIATLVAFGLLFVAFGSFLFVLFRGQFDPKSFNPPAFGVTAAAALLVLIVVNLLMHAYVTAGNASELLHGARAGGRPVFDFERWRRAAGSRMLPVLGIYVIFLLFTVAVTVAVGVVLGIFGALTRGAGACCAVVLLVPLLLPIIAFIAAWSTQAVMLSAGRDRSAMEAIGDALALTRSALWTNIGAAAVIGLVAIIGAVVVAGVFTVINVAALAAAGKSSALMTVVVLPLRILGTILQQAWVAATGCWFLGAMGEMIQAQTPRPPAAPPAVDVQPGWQLPPPPPPIA